MLISKRSDLSCRPLEVFCSGKKQREAIDLTMAVCSVGFQEAAEQLRALASALLPSPKPATPQTSPENAVTDATLQSPGRPSQKQPFRHNSSPNDETRQLLASARGESQRISAHYACIPELRIIFELLESTVLLACVNDALRRGRANPGQCRRGQGTSAPSRIASIVVAYWAIRAAWSTPLMIRRAFL